MSRGRDFWLFMYGVAALPAFLSLIAFALVLVGQQGAINMAIGSAVVAIITIGIVTVLLSYEISMRNKK